MPASKAGKRGGQAVPARGANAPRQPKRNARKRGRDAPATEADAPPSTTSATTASEVAQTTEPVLSSPPVTPAGRSTAHDAAPSATPSLLSDRSMQESDREPEGEDKDKKEYESGLVHSTTSLIAASSGEEAASVHDSAAVAKLRREVGEAAKNIRREVESSITRFAAADAALEQLAAARQLVQPRVDEVVQSRAPELYTEAVTLNVGGEVFTVPIGTLLSKDSPNYFHVLLGVEESEGGRALFRDSNKIIFIDRDPACFKHILGYFRGYQYFNLLKEDTVRHLKVDAAYYQLPGLLAMLGELERDAELQFNAGPGVSLERNRLRVVYGVAMVGDVFLVTGRHVITYEVKVADYIGFGLVSEACVNTDQEFHKIPDCCVYYMSGVFYTNYPYHRKEENLERIENNDFVTMKIDLDKGYVEYVLKNSHKMVSIGRARRLRFATTMKLASRVRIVPPEEVRRRLPPVHYTFDEDAHP